MHGVSLSVLSSSYALCCFCYLFYFVSLLSRVSWVYFFFLSNLLRGREGVKKSDFSHKLNPQLRNCKLPVFLQTLVIQPNK